MSTYNFDCSCGEHLSVEAESDDAAVEMLLAAGKTHLETFVGEHPPMPPMEELPSVLRAGMQKADGGEMSGDTVMDGSMDTGESMMDDDTAMDDDSEKAM